MHSDDGFTYYYQSKHPEAGYNFVYAKNLCYNFKKKRYYVLNRVNSRSLPIKRDVAFHYGWQIVNTYQTIDDMNAIIIEKESVITQPFTLHHIYHFIESINFLWTKLLFVNEFPVVSVLFNSQS